FFFIRLEDTSINFTLSQKGGLLWGYKPPILASVSRRWLSLCSSHTGFVAFATSQEVFLSLSNP
ncbi:hypothetical protein, partial [Tetragenococcus halophilus]